MASLTLKDIPEALLERLRRAAERERRSLTQEALFLIEGGLAQRESAEERAHRQLEAWRALAGYTSASFEDEVRAICTSGRPGRDPAKGAPRSSRPWRPGNRRHFERVQGVVIEDWLQPR